MKPRLILCGGAGFKDVPETARDYNVTELNSWGANANVHIRIEDVANAFLRELSDRLVDLVEIASYVYAADCLAPRDHAWSDSKSTEPWSRDFKFAIPVRDTSFWSQDQVRDLLSHLLHFLADDNYVFRFERPSTVHPTQSYLEFGDFQDWPFRGVERVLMFSGGLDSLAGALETASANQHLVLVSHRAAPVVSKRQRHLFQELQKVYPQTRMLHIPVWVNKEAKLGREHTQRTRSFLFAALGAAVAHSLDAAGVRFFENGIVSLNWPVADEVLRARASRTTHPVVLRDLSELLTLVLEKPFVVDNPYIFMTKTDVVTKVGGLGGGELIRHTCSCAHTGLYQSQAHWHCGTCSQCIDRRIAILAAGLADEDPNDDYAVDVFEGPRKDGYEKNMAVNYIRHAFELSRMSDQEMAAKFNLELTRAARFVPGKQSETAQKFIDMHRRHGAAVRRVVCDQVATAVPRMFAGEVVHNSMLMFAIGNEHLISCWVRYAKSIEELLRTGLPISCASHKPKNERHLQQLCDGILKPRDNDLTREFPFMQWSSTLTKPDWSNEALRLWIEAKYVRTTADIGRTTEAIAADITKYGDNGRNVLYVVYDPSHCIVDEDEFSEPITRHASMRVAFIR